MAMIRLSDDTDIAIAADTDLESIPGTQTFLASIGTSDRNICSNFVQCVGFYPLWEGRHSE